jgi:Mrp family chromosome partitioning ATPase
MSAGPVDQLSVLPSGTWGDQPVDELLRRRFESVMAAATTEFDSVVVLGPPLELSDDARTMAVGATLLLAIGQGEVSVNALRTHADRVRAAGGRLLGVVLVNRRPARAPRPAAVLI